MLAILFEFNAIVMVSALIVESKLSNCGCGGAARFSSVVVVAVAATVAVAAVFCRNCCSLSLLLWLLLLLLLLLKLPRSSDVAAVGLTFIPNRYKKTFLHILMHQPESDRSDGCCCCGEHGMPYVIWHSFWLRFRRFFIRAPFYNVHIWLFNKVFRYLSLSRSDCHKTNATYKLFRINFFVLVVFILFIFECFSSDYHFHSSLRFS